MTPDLKLFAAKSVAKLAQTGLALSKTGSGTSLPGKLALKCNPDLLKTLNNTLQLGFRLGITGTNGKTTTAGLTAALLKSQLGPDAMLVHNLLGANMKNGLTTTLLNAPTTASAAILELDEASLQGFVNDFKLDALLVSNLFRDQLDRYGELDTTARMIAAGFPGVAQTLLLNADDPLVTHLAEAGQATGKQCLFYGIEAVTFPQASPTETPLTQTVPFPCERINCPATGVPLTYSRQFYGHLGHYASPGLTRPRPQIMATQVALGITGSELQISLPNQTLSLQHPLPGLFNVYNLLAALAAVHTALGGRMLEVQALQNALNAYTGVFGRAECRIINGKTVRVFLIKNPVGASEVIRLVASDPTAPVVIAINDHYADGRDVSWLWDAPFEWFAATQGPIFTAGERATDMSVRLKYAGVSPQQLQCHPNVIEAINAALNTSAPGETLYVLPTYTVLLQLKQWLSQFPSA
ncbi:MAG: MurT ligase domain-containing protein [Vampirovibrionales bacterium]|nr:MurT ligase domain-containing protein [Vampirovibrionales bacterium]